MRNSKLAYLFTYNTRWKLVFISIINAVSTHSLYIIVFTFLRILTILDILDFSTPLK